MDYTLQQCLFYGAFTVLFMLVHNIGVKSIYNETSEDDSVDYKLFMSFMVLLFCLLPLVSLVMLLEGGIAVASYWLFGSEGAQMWNYSNIAYKAGIGVILFLMAVLWTAKVVGDHHFYQEGKKTLGY